MRILQSHPALRWVVPVVAAGVIGGTSLLAVTATAQPALPDRSPEQLLVDLQQAKVDQFSGTIVQKSDLGLPQLPGVGSSYDTSLTSLISGTHTLQVWSSGQDKQRLAIHGTLGETDLIRNGTNVWEWSSRDNAATHTTLPSRTAQQPQSPPSDAPTTPQEAAQKALRAVEPTTTIRTDRAVEVANRPAYALILEPKDSGSLIRQVRIAVDAEKKVPLSVQVLAAGNTTVFETSFTSIDFTAPDNANFAFNPPAGTTVTEKKAPSADEQKAAAQKAQTDKSGGRPTKVGTGWSAVMVGKFDPSQLSGKNAGASGESSGSGQLKQILAALPKVSGSWGSGRLLTSKAFSAVITDDGRVAVGAVAPEKLYQALS